MANINLLPWREELRQKKNQDYYAVLGGTAILAAFLLYLVNSFYDSAISGQNQRINYLKKETEIIQAKIEEINNLRDTRDQLVERMELIQALQGNRPVIVRVFDEMARSVPDSLYYTRIKFEGSQVILTGIAESNNRVASLMRNFDESPWFKDPELLSVEAQENGGNQFEISMKRVDPKSEEEEG